METGKYKVPEDIRKHKPTGSVVKKINGAYYVYDSVSYKNKKGKWSSKSGEILGKIDPVMGYIPNKKALDGEKITCLEFGQYLMIMETTKTVLNALVETFNKQDAYEIYFLAMMYYVNDFTSMANIASLYSQSYLHIKYRIINLSYHNIAKLLDNLGRKTELVEQFQQSLIEKSSSELAIDGHCMVSYSKDNNLAKYGNKYRQTHEMQVNILMAYDINTSIPVYSKAYMGSLLDKTSVKTVIRHINKENILYIVDSGFYSDENIELFSSNNCKYIIPLSSNLSAYKKIAEKQFDPTKYFVTGSRSGKTPIFYNDETIDGKRVIMYKDLTRQALEQDDYRSRIGISPNHTEKKYEQLKDGFGVIILQTNLDTDAEEIYQRYKKRWKIETFYNFLKNEIEFDTTNQQDYYKIQGLSFIMQIVGMINREFILKIRNLNQPANSVLTEGRFIKLVKNKSVWEIGNYNKKTKEMFESLSIDLANIDTAMPKI